MKYLSQVLRQFKLLKFSFLLAVVLCEMSALCKTLYALSLSAFLDEAVLANGIPLNLLWWIFILLFSHLALFYFSEKVFGNLLLKGTYLLNEKNTNKLLGISIHSDFSRGDLLNRVTRDSSDFKNAIAGLLRGSIFTALTMLIILGILCFVCWPLALAAFILPIVYNLLVLKFSDGKQQEQNQERDQMGKLASCVEDRLTSKEEIRFGRLETVVDKKHAELLGQWGNIRKTLSRFWSQVGTCDTFFYLTYRLVILLLGVFFVRRGVMTYGDIFTFLALSSAFTNFIWDFKAESYRDSVAAAQRLLDFWAMPDERMDGKSLPWKESPCVQVKNLSFSYSKENWVLEDVSFSVQNGETMGFIGKSGCGKTTMLDLLCGFFEAQDGAIWIGGAPITQWKLSELRKHMAYMQQNTTLIQGTLVENIAFMEEQDISSADRLRMTDILSDVGLSYLKEGEGENSDGKIKWRIENLSQGELQRIGFARCLFKNADIWLLDEPTSALDAENEEAVAALLQKFKDQGITILVITHRLNILKRFDRVAVFKQGTISQVANSVEETVL